MAFNGTYLTIDGTAFPTAYMVIPSYKVNNEPIIVNDYYDANYNRHIIKAPAENVTITFRLRQQYNDTYPAVLAFFTDEMEVTYYEPKTDSYLTDTFTYINNLTPEIDRQYNNKVLFKELEMKLVRKAASE